MVPDKAEYQPGDTAQVLVQAPFATGSGLLVIARNGDHVDHHASTVADGSAVVQIPVTEADLPNVEVTIEVVGSTPRTADDGTPSPDAPQRPAFAIGGLSLPVSTASRTLDVTATPAASQLAPGRRRRVDVGCTDAAGPPVAGAELAVVVVDEAVLALTDYELADPLGTFYGQLPSQLSTSYGRNSIVLVDPDAFFAGAPGATTRRDGDHGAGATAAHRRRAARRQPRADGWRRATPRHRRGAARPRAPRPPIDVRTNFDALAVFAPGVTTDAERPRHDRRDRCPTTSPATG